MQGIKSYSHSERTKIINKLVPYIKEHFGQNLIALAAQASYARNEDTDYSDLELIAFVKELPDGKSILGTGQIYQGMLIELIWTTKENYLKNVLDINEEWYLSGSNILEPIINSEFIREISEFN